MQELGTLTFTASLAREVKKLCSKMKNYVNERKEMAKEDC